MVSLVIILMDHLFNNNGLYVIHLQVKIVNEETKEVFTCVQRVLKIMQELSDLVNVLETVLRTRFMVVVIVVSFIDLNINGSNNDVIDPSIDDGCIVVAYADVAYGHFVYGGKLFVIYYVGIQQDLLMEETNVIVFINPCNIYVALGMAFLVSFWFNNIHGFNIRRSLKMHLQKVVFDRNVDLEIFEHFLVSYIVGGIISCNVVIHQKDLGLVNVYVFSVLDLDYIVVQDPVV